METIMKSAREFRQEALSVLPGRWGLAIGATLLYGILNGGLTGVFSPELELREDSVLSFEALVPYIGILLAMFAISLVFSAIGASVQLGYNIFLLKYYEPEQKPSLGDLFCRFHIFWKAFGLRLVKELLITLWALLPCIPGAILLVLLLSLKTILPGIPDVILLVLLPSLEVILIVIFTILTIGLVTVMSYSYAMAPYLMAENPDMGIMEAIRRSKEIMHGNKWRLFCLHFSFIGWAFLCLFTCAIGYLFLSPYQMLAEVAFYREITGKNHITYTEPTDFYYTNPIQ